MLIAENKHPSSRMLPGRAPIKRLLRQRRAFKTSIHTTSSLQNADPQNVESTKRRSTKREYTNRRTTQRRVYHTPIHTIQTSTCQR